MRKKAEKAVQKCAVVLEKENRWNEMAKCLLLGFKNGTKKYNFLAILEGKSSLLQDLTVLRVDKKAAWS